jgi:hypothetical protein
MANLDLINDLLDKAENRYRLTSLSSDTESHRSSCVPTGQLMLDACLAGGLPSGRWITVYGGEGSAKSTTMQTFMHAFGRLGIPGSYMDFEGSLCSQYLSHIIRTIGKVRAYESEGEDVVTKLFGLKGPNGKWVQKPLYRLYTEGVGDTFFNMLAEILRLLPDKVHVDGKWYLVYKEKPSDAKIDKTLSPAEPTIYFFFRKSRKIHSILKKRMLYGNTIQLRRLLSSLNVFQVPMTPCKSCKETVPSLYSVAMPVPERIDCTAFKGILFLWKRGWDLSISL